jgi:hypothetical protein
MIRFALAVLSLLALNFPYLLTATVKIVRAFAT